MTAMAGGLLALLLGRGQNLPLSECLALLMGTAGGLANLIDILRLGAVVDFVPLFPGALASPGDFLVAGGFLGLIPLTLRHAQQGHGLYGLYRTWRTKHQ
jgi:lipoprotein signal peptidase